VFYEATDGAVGGPIAPGTVTRVKGGVLVAEVIVDGTTTNNNNNNNNNNNKNKKK